MEGLADFLWLLIEKGMKNVEKIVVG